MEGQPTAADWTASLVWMKEVGAEAEEEGKTEEVLQT